MQDGTTRPLAVVTGASSGIGLELARQFATHGFDVVVTAEDAELTVAADALSAEGTAVRSVRADLTTAVGVATLVEELTGLGRRSTRWPSTRASARAAPSWRRRSTATSR